ncbi:MAG TPA: MoaD/ThiS family protein [Acidimicrobiales bacterium]|nr:MoaD/ThiS family protein [Acidimicrobiales bacterium]
MKVRIPTPLRSYTAQQSVVEAEGATVDAVLRDLDRQFPGIRFRVVDEQNDLRKHMKIWVNQDAVRDLSTPVTDADEVTLMQALSGG